MEPRALILTGYGINCEKESKFAFEKSGGKADIFHINELIERPDAMESYNFLMIPGGFAFGDDLGSGKVLANKIKFRLKDKLLDFINAGKLVLGTCNGFQVLVKLGMLPYPDLTQRVTLTVNDSGHFEDRWVRLKFNAASPCIFTKGIDYMALPVRHGEGKFLPADQNVLADLTEKNLVAAQYCDEQGRLAGYPHNPNGSISNIAGICDPTGRVYGMMPHPEAFNEITNSPMWQTGTIKEAQGLWIFRNAIAYIREKF